MLSNKFAIGQAVFVGPNVRSKSPLDVAEKPWAGIVTYVTTTETSQGHIHSYGVEPSQPDKFGPRDVLEYRLTAG